MFRSLMLAVAVVATGIVAAPDRAQAQQFYLGEIIMGGWNFCPRGTASAAGQVLQIAPNTALFSLYGCTYGGDCRTTFALPDLRGRVAVNQGNGPGLSPVVLGERGGGETFTSTIATMANHTHAITNTTTATANVGPGPAGAFEAGDHLTATASAYAGQGAPNQPLQDGTVAVTVTSTALNTGGQQPVNIRNPFLGITYCVVTEGTFPPRS